MMARTGRILTTLWVVATGSACSSFTPREAPDAVAGSYTGTLDIGTDRLQGRLHLEQRGHRLTGQLSASGVDARGSGEIEGAGFVLRLDYRTECRGTLTLSGRSTENGHLVGSVRAEDCTGRVTGSFTFRP